MMIYKGHFTPVSDMGVARVMFKNSVKSVEIEIFSYCNRICSFCGNSFINRRGKNHLMEPALYSKILDDLASIQYDGKIWYSRYNEPTADRVFLDRLREARAKLPQAQLVTYSNGDYLDRDYLEELRDAGLNEITIMTYLPNGTPPTVENFLNTTIKRLNSLGLPWKFIQQNVAQVEIPGITVTAQYYDFNVIGTNRGGALESGRVTETRVSPCTYPFTNLYVDYNGCMVPCCDIRSDYEKHRDFVLHTLTTENSILEAYVNIRFAEWRRHLMSFDEKGFPCNSCSRGVIADTPAAREAFAGGIAMARESEAQALAEPPRKAG